MKIFCKSIFIVLAILLPMTLLSQKAEVKRIDPPFWWSGMKSNSLQLMVYGNNISVTQPKISDTSVFLKQVISVESPNYLFLDLDISSAKAGVFNIDFFNGKKKVISIVYQLKSRELNPDEMTGFDNSDAIYLLMPDRFANGNPDNDDMPGMLEKANRSNPNGRHGGDIQGIVNNLDYIKDLGATSIWINPLLENNMPAYSYHGYAVTDLYKVDARFGTNEDYKNLVRTAH